MSLNLITFVMFKVSKEERERGFNKIYHFHKESKILNLDFSVIPVKLGIIGLVNRSQLDINNKKVVFYVFLFQYFYNF